MWLRVVRATCFTTLTVIAVPYAVAVVTNILFGWPLCTKRYRRAFNPQKVLALNWALLRHLGNLRYFGLAFRWRRFYRSASRNRLLKNIPYGSNGNSLDMYFPVEETIKKDTVSKYHKPVVVFIYGGSWGSGDKNIYGLLAAQLADNLSAVVICPNYSIYPKGFVDDMAQDVSDVIAFIHQHCDIYCLDRGRIALIGHSAGAHLAALTVLELSMKHLSDEPAGEVFRRHEQRRADSLQISVIDGSVSSGDALRMHEGHFDDDSLPCDTESKHNDGLLSSVVSSLFYVVPKNKNEEASSAAAEDVATADDVAQPSSAEVQSVAEAQANGNESFYFIDENSIAMNADGSDEIAASEASQQPVDTEAEEQCEEAQDTAEPHDQAEDTADDTETSVKAPVITSPSSSVAPVPSSSLPDPLPPTLSASVNDPDSLLTSIRLVIGMSGVYDIASHYEHEKGRGVEDISTMARAMYGPKRFDRFSPTLIVEHLPQNAWLPPIHLIHGDNDRTVPVSSSVYFGDAVWRRGASSVTATVISGCGHIDVCFDLMESDRFWYRTVMNEIRRVFVQHVQQT